MKTKLIVFSAAMFLLACNQKPAPVSGNGNPDSTLINRELGLSADENPFQSESAGNVTKEAGSKTGKTSQKAEGNATSATSGTATSASGGSGTGSTAGTGESKEKKGWSKTAKGAVIGGVVGAGTGAIVNKKDRAAGAVVGGVVGAGAGAIIGHEMDKKDGRHQ